MHFLNRNLSVLTAVLSFNAATVVRADNAGESAVVTGMVTRVSGVPLSRAWVFLFQREPGALFFPKPGEILDACRADPSGRFELRTQKWKHHALHQIIVPGRTIQRHPIKGEVVEEYYVLTSNLKIQSPNRLLVPEGFVPNAKDPRKGLPDHRALDKK